MVLNRDYEFEDGDPYTPPPVIQVPPTASEEEEESTPTTYTGWYPDGYWDDWTPPTAGEEPPIEEDLPEWMTTQPTATYNPTTGVYTFNGVEYDLSSFYGADWEPDTSAYDYFDPEQGVWVSNLAPETEGMFWNPSVGQWEETAYWNPVEEDTPPEDVPPVYPDWMTTGPNTTYNPETGIFTYAGIEYDLNEMNPDLIEAYKDADFLEQSYDYWDPVRGLWIRGGGDQAEGMFWNPDESIWQETAYWDTSGGGSSDDRDDELDDQTGDATEDLPDIDYEGGVESLASDIAHADVIRERNLHYTAGSLTDMPDDLVRANAARSIEEADMYMGGARKWYDVIMF